jgi:hypothetical protein
MALAESFEPGSLCNGGKKASEIAKRRGNDEYAEFLQGWELSKREAAAIANEARPGSQKSKGKAL